MFDDFESRLNSRQERHRGALSKKHRDQEGEYGAEQEGEEEDQE